MPSADTPSGGSARNLPIAHCDELDAEPEPVVIFPLTGHQLTIGVVQVEEPLKVRQRHRATITAKGRRLLITEKLHRHVLHAGPDHQNPASQRPDRNIAVTLPGSGPMTPAI